MKRTAENFIQQECVMDFNNNYCLKHHNPRCLIYSIPNESIDGWEAQKKVNMGLLKGASDTVVLLPNGISIFMECKAPDGVQSTSQKAFQDRVEELGFKYHIFRSKKQFYDVLIPYMTWLKK